MPIPDYFISCDWGTTNFRLYVVGTDTLEIEYRIESKEGIKPLYNRFIYTNHNNQFEFYRSFILDQIHQLPKEFQNLDMVIGGMASANIGMKELPYATFPISRNGHNLYWEEININNDHQAILVSGVRSQTGIMRGEEIQAIGVMDYFPQVEKATIVLPGTHSKHIHFAFDEFIDMRNYMTGEVFDILQEHSILSNSVEKTAWNTQFESVFLDGVYKGIDNLSGNLFSIRAEDVLNQVDKKENYYVLSGMLIGDEISYLRDDPDPIIVAAPEPLSTLYNLALETIISADRILCLSARSYDQANLIGRRKILILKYEK